MYDFLHIFSAVQKAQDDVDFTKPTGVPRASASRRLGSAGSTGSTSGTLGRKSNVTSKINSGSKSLSYTPYLIVV